ncbi:MAG TPA: hypothetical protein VFN51_03635 [Candidatus Saccharimonadales bacterium]|nr:hypothetical protein [Candidatus Saccharimonadales bacterium]
MEFGIFFNRFRKTHSRQSEPAEPASNAARLGEALGEVDIERFMTCYRSVVQRSFSKPEAAQMWNDLWNDFGGLEVIKERVREVAIEETVDRDLGLSIALGTTIAFAALREYIASSKQREQFPDIPE